VGNGTADVFSTAAETVQEAKNFSSMSKRQRDAIAEKRARDAAEQQPGRVYQNPLAHKH
jgi:hypothetical protein